MFKRINQLFRPRAAGTIFSALATLFATGATCWALQDADLITQSDAKRAGLELAWTSHVALDSARDIVTDLSQQIGPRKQWFSFEVKTDEATVTFSERDRNASGELLGAVGAKKKADEYVARMASYGFEATIEVKQHPLPPEVYVYALTSSSLVHCINGETGETLWSTQVGNRSKPSFFHADRGYVAVVNGSKIFCLNGVTGKILWERQTRGAPSAPPAITRHYVFVPMFNGLIEEFHLRKHQKPSEAIQSLGRIFEAATAAPDSVTWVTDVGQLNLADGNESDRRGVRFRLQASGKINAPAVYAELEADKANVPRYAILTASTGGDVYCIAEISGAILWNFPTGLSIEQSPRVFEKDVYVVTNNFVLFDIDLKSGLEIWRTSGIKEIVSASDTRLYALDRTNRLTVLDRTNGNRISVLPTETRNLYMENQQTDRLFIGSKSGALQCLHELAHEQPMFHYKVMEQKQREPQGPKRKVEEGAGVDKPAEGGEFSEDPFGAGSEMSEDPFGVGGGGDDESPFKGGGGNKQPMEKETPKGADDNDPFGN